MAGLPRTLSKADRAYHTGGVERLGERGEQAREGDPVRAVGDAGSPVTGAADSVTGDEDLEIGAAEPEEVARRWRRGGDEVARRSVRTRACGREDSNLHPRRDRDLNPARLPVPPRPRVTPPGGAAG